MNTSIILIIGIFAGFFMKLADDISDTSSRFDKWFAIPLGIMYGSLIGYLMINDPDASMLFGGIVLGCLITGKIDRQCHYFALTSILLLVFISGIKLPLLVLVVAALASFDEMKDFFPNPGIKFIFDYRLFLKTGIFLSVVFNLLEPKAILLLIAFDLAYIITGKLGSRLIHDI